MDFKLFTANCEGVNFINILRAHFLYKSALRSFSLVTFLQKKHFRAKNAAIKR
jgi:hypothetical protein